MKALLGLVLLLASAGCADTVVTAARVTIAADEVLLTGEKSFPVYDRTYQSTLGAADLHTYRTETRPRVEGSFEALTGAAQVARQAIELGATGKLDLAPVLTGLCRAVEAFKGAAAAAKWPPPGALGIAVTLCAGVR